MSEVIHGGYDFLKRGLLVTKTNEAVADYCREWARETKERVSQGEPLVVPAGGAVHAGYAVEICNAMDIPTAPYMSFLQNWNYWDLVDGKEQEDEFQKNLALAKSYEVPDPFCGHCNMFMAGLGRLPKVTAIISEESECPGIDKANWFWRLKYDIPTFQLDLTATLPHYPRYGRWWERINDHWDEVIEPHRLDYQVEQTKLLIRFLEDTTGKTFSQDRLAEVLEIATEQYMYMRKTRDLIAKTVPAPVGTLENLYLYSIQTHRGSPKARDLAKMYYEEVKDRVDNGEALCPNEKVRLWWGRAAQHFDAPFYRDFEEKYGAVFVGSYYLSIAESYIRRIINDDPLRALASLAVCLGLYHGAEFDIKEAKLHKANGAVITGNRCTFPGVLNKTFKMAFEAAGIPLLVLDPSLDMEKKRAVVSDFIETRLS